MAIPQAHGVQIGVLTGIADLLIYHHFVPPVSDIRTAEPLNPDIENAERKALIATIGLTAVAAWFTRSWEVFAIGGIAIIVADFGTKHANAINPDTSKMVQTTPNVATDNAGSFPVPDYSSSDGM